MLCGAAGMVVGGFLVARAERLERMIAACLVGAAAAARAGGHGRCCRARWRRCSPRSPGFGTGLAGPSRDMLIKRAAPPGATGRVYGTVYSGLDLGFALGAPVFGVLLDHGSPSSVFYGAALMLLLGVASASLVGLRHGEARGLPAESRHDAGARAWPATCWSRP